MPVRRAPGTHTPPELLRSARSDALPQPAHRGALRIRTRSDLAKLKDLRAVSGDLHLELPDLRAADLEGLPLERVTGRLHIVGTDLERVPLRSLRRVDGEVRISQNPKLRSLDGLALKDVGLIAINDNPALTEVKLDLRSAWSVQLVRNGALTNLDGLSLPARITGFVSLKQNPNLVDVSALSGLRRASGLYVEDNHRLSRTAGLAQIQADDVVLRRNGFAADALTASPPSDAFEVVTTPPAAAPAAQPVASSPTTDSDGAPVIPPAEWSFFVYLNADNDLEPFGAKDLDEMRSVGSRPGQVNVFALIDGHGHYAPRRDGWTAGTRLVWIPPAPAGGKSDPVEIPVAPQTELGRLLSAGRGELNMGDPAVLRAAMRYLAANYPSDKTAVDLWNHGNAHHHAGLDMSAGDELNIAGGELFRALEGLDVDLLGFDACLMSSLEVAEVAERLGVEVLVASEEIEPASGWAYDRILSTLPSGSIDAGTLGDTLVSAYAASGSANVTLAATRIEGLAKVRAALDAFSREALAVGGLQEPRLAELYARALRFNDSPASSDSHTQMDLADFASRVAARFGEPLKSAARSLVDAVVATSKPATGRPGSRYDRARGLSIYAPVGRAAYGDGAQKIPRSWRDLVRSQLGPVPAPSTTPVAPPPSALTRGVTLTDQPAPAGASHLNPRGDKLRFRAVRGAAGPVLQLRGQLKDAPWKIHARVVRDDAARTARVILDFYREAGVPSEDREPFIDVDLALDGLSGDWKIEVEQSLWAGTRPLASLALSSSTPRARE